MDLVNGVDASLDLGGDANLLRVQRHLKLRNARGANDVGGSRKAAFVTKGQRQRCRVQIQLPGKSEVFVDRLRDPRLLVALATFEKSCASTG